jgi:hypothetical protein
LLAVIGFYLGQVASYKWVGRLVAPTEVQAVRALEGLPPGGALEEGSSLRSLAVAISKVVAERAKMQVNPGDIWRVQRGVPTAEFGMGGLQQRLPLLVFLRGQEQPRALDYALLLRTVQENVSARALLWSSIVFWLGIILTAITSYALEEARPAPNSRAAQQ